MVQDLFIFACETSRHTFSVPEKVDSDSNLAWTHHDTWFREAAAFINGQSNLAGNGAARPDSVARKLRLLGAKYAGDWDAGVDDVLNRRADGIMRAETISALQRKVTSLATSLQNMAQAQKVISISEIQNAESAQIFLRSYAKDGCARILKNCELMQEPVKYLLGEDGFIALANAGMNGLSSSTKQNFIEEVINKQAKEEMVSWLLLHLMHSVLLGGNGLLSKSSAHSLGNLECHLSLT